MRAATPAELNVLSRLVDVAAEEAIVTVDGKVAYPVLNGIYALIKDQAVYLDGSRPPGQTLRPEKLAVQQFYDDVGWQEGQDGFADTDLFADGRSVSAEYHQRTLERVNGHLPECGTYLLDAASGAVPHDGYLAFSDAFDTRVCVDFSLEALMAARAKLGDKAMCVLADVTELPFLDDSLDAAVSLHTIYHLPADDQARAFCELHRVIRAGGPAVIVYSWGRLRAHQILRIPFTIAHLWRRIVEHEAAAGIAVRELLHYAPQTYKWFTQHEWPFEYTIEPMSALGTTLLKGYFPDNRFGAWMLRGLYALENRFPKAFARWGQYPLIVITKA
jgi:ubiquinone/menaquinone biosynthesis C-methylase UbiE